MLSKLPLYLVVFTWDLRYAVYLTHWQAYNSSLGLSVSSITDAGSDPMSRLVVVVTQPCRTRMWSELGFGNFLEESSFFQWRAFQLLNKSTSGGGYAWV